MNGIGYLRVSTENQEDNYGLDAQKEIITNYSRTHDITIVEWVSDTISGTTDWNERKGLLTLLSDNVNYTNPPFECVVVARNDRLARDVTNFFAFKYMFDKKNLKLISCEQDFGQFGMYADMFEALIVSMASIERHLIVMRTQAGKEIKLNNGGYGGGKVPYGYIVKNGEYVVNEEEAKVIRTLFNLLDSRYSLRATANHLNNMGYRTQNGGLFTVGQIQSINNRRKFYEGYNLRQPDKRGTQKAIVGDNRE